MQYIFTLCYCYYYYKYVVFLLCLIISSINTVYFYSITLNTVYSNFRTQCFGTTSLVLLYFLLWTRWFHSQDRNRKLVSSEQNCFHLVSRIGTKGQLTVSYMNMQVWLLGKISLIDINFIKFKIQMYATYKIRQLICDSCHMILSSNFLQILLSSTVTNHASGVTNWSQTHVNNQT